MKFVVLAMADWSRRSLRVGRADELFTSLRRGGGGGGGGGEVGYGGREKRGDYIPVATLSPPE